MTCYEYIIPTLGYLVEQLIIMVLFKVPLIKKRNDFTKFVISCRFVQSSKRLIIQKNEVVNDWSCIYHTAKRYVIQPAAPPV